MRTTHALPKIVTFPDRQPAKAKRKRRRPARWFFAGLCLMILYFGVVYVGQEIRLMELRSQERELRTQSAALLDDAVALRRELELLGTDAHIERIARERFGLILPQDKFLWPALLPRPGR